MISYYSISSYCEYKILKNNNKKNTHTHVQVGVTPDYSLPGDLPLTTAEDACTVLSGNVGRRIVDLLIPPPGPAQLPEAELTPVVIL